jgi:hypothetical protein
MVTGAALLRRGTCVIALLLLAEIASAGTFRVFGSAGAESQLTPANERSPLNPGNVAGIPGQTNVADVSLYTEAKPESGAWKLRLKLRGDSSDRDREHLTVGEALLQLRATSWLDLAAGRILEKWGTGYAWTPTAFVGPARNPTDPTDRRSQTSGVDMLRADLFVKETSVSVYALQHGAFAARAYRLLGGTDVSLAYRHDRQGTRAGLSLSRVFGDALELHGEVGRDGATTRAVAGGQYTIHEVNLVAEVYHGTDGLTRGQWDDVRTLANRGALLEANRVYAPLRMARTYSFLRIDRAVARWKAEGELIAITNLRDGSTIVRATLSKQLLPNLSAYLIDTEFVGRNGSEMAYLQIARLVAVGVRRSF